VPVLLLAPGGMRSCLANWESQPYDPWTSHGFWSMPDAIGASYGPLQYKSSILLGGSPVRRVERNSKDGPVRNRAMVHSVDDGLENLGDGIGSAVHRVEDGF
jgi:hypothetical protein